MSSPHASSDPAVVATLESAPSRARINRLGVASLGLGVSGLSAVILIMAIYMIETDHGVPRGRILPVDAEVIVVWGLFACAGFLLAPLGFFLGGGALFLRGREKISPAVGMCLSVITIMCLMGMFIWACAQPY